MLKRIKNQSKTENKSEIDHFIDSQNLEIESAINASHLASELDNSGVPEE